MLSIHSKMRKHFEYCCEATEQIERIFFMSNSLNFLFVDQKFTDLLQRVEKCVEVL